MSKSLVIVESPTKARTIKRYLGKDFDVEASMGHIKDLPKSKLGVDIEDGFKPEYKVKPDKRDVVSKLKKLAAGADHIYLAADPDREGEAIAWHVAEELKKSKAPVDRIIFHEITKSAIKTALESPKELNKSLYDAQMARRSMDRIVGYTMSPLLWKKVKRGLSGGRVQSVAVRLICERQDEIDAFIPQEYWSIDVNLKTDAGDSLPTRVVIPKEIANEDETNDICRQIQDAAAIEINDIKKKVRNRNPLPPFITSTLQQAASSRLRFSAKKTMMVAQQLYEGLPIGGEEISGLITYMRTDSPVISKEAIAQARDFIPENYGNEYLPAQARNFKAKKSAQEAHEAIRPTAVQNTPERLKKYLNKDQHALYELIWKRFLASQMENAIFDQTSIEIQAGDIGLRCSGSIQRFDGFLKLYQVQEEKDTILPQGLETGDKLSLDELLPKQHFTQPPARYTEASLIKELEERGIGRPSTYAPTISTIQDRGYVELKNRAFYPTELGRDVNGLLVKNYPNILNIDFTVHMEEALDKVEEGSQDYAAAMQNFYETYNSEHEKAQEEMENLKAAHRPAGINCSKCGKEMLIKLGKNGHFLGCSGYPDCNSTAEYTRNEEGKIEIVIPPEPEETDQACEKCGKPMVIKHGRYGAFLACSGYPDCKNTQPLEKPETTDKKCDKCGAPMLVKKGRRGPFLGCSKYPECSNIMPYPLGLKCPLPDCKGEILQQRSRRGKTFYACSEESCEFVCWTKPIAKPCPQCQKSDFLVLQEGKHACPNPDCNYDEPKES